MALSASSRGPGSGRCGSSSVNDVSPDNVVIGIWGISPFIVFVYVSFSWLRVLGTAWATTRGGVGRSQEEGHFHHEDALAPFKRPTGATHGTRFLFLSFLHRYPSKQHLAIFQRKQEETTARPRSHYEEGIVKRRDVVRMYLKGTSKAKSVWRHESV